MFYSPHCPRVNIGLTVFPSVHSGCGGQNMAASQGRLVGFRGLHSTKCLLRTTNISSAKATTSKGIGAKEFRKTFFTSFLRKGRTIPAILKSWKRHKLISAGRIGLASFYRPWSYLRSPPSFFIGSSVKFSDV